MSIDLATAHRLAGVALAILAVMLASGDRAHRPLAALLSGQAIVNLVRPALRASFGLDGPMAAVPFQGWQRAAYFADAALFALWAPGLAWTALVVLGGRTVRAAAPLPVAIWLITVAAIVIGYPTIRGAGTDTIYLGAELASLACSALTWREVWESRGRLSFARGVVLLVVAFEALPIFAGPYRYGLFAAWTLALAADLVLFGAVVALLGGALWLAK